MQSLALMRAVHYGAWLRIPTLSRSPPGPASFPQPAHPPKAGAAAALTHAGACTEAEPCLHRSSCSVPKFLGAGGGGGGVECGGWRCSGSVVGCRQSQEPNAASPVPFASAESAAGDSHWAGQWLGLDGCFTLGLSRHVFTFCTSCLCNCSLISLPLGQAQLAAAYPGWLQRIPAGCPYPGSPCQGCFVVLISVYVQPSARCLAGGMAVPEPAQAWGAWLAPCGLC